MTVEAPPTSLYGVLTDYRAQLVEGYKPLLQDVYSHIGQINQRAQDHLKELNILVDDAISAGKEPTRHWLYQQKRYQSLVAQLEAELLQVGEILSTGLEASRNRAIALGNTMVKDAYGLLADIPVGIERSFATFPMEAAQQLILMTQPGPVRRVLEKYSAEGAQRAADALINGISLGHGPAKISRELRQSLGISAVRATTIARTETMRAFREASRLNMMANADILEGWVWESSRQKSTCAVCWAMQGTLFTFPVQFDSDASITVEEAQGRGLIPMYTHPNCRCVMAPRPASYADILGDPSIPDNRPPITSGADAFAKLDPATQRRILGPGRHQLYQNGMPLRDMLTARADKDWGIVRGLKPVGRIKPTETAFALLSRLKAQYPGMVMFNGIDKILPANALAILKRFEQLADKYPHISEQLSAINVVPHASKWGGAATTQTMTIRTYGLDSAENAAKAAAGFAESSRKAGQRWLVSHDPEDIVTHEFGHLLVFNRLNGWHARTGLGSKTYAPRLRKFMSDNRRTSASAYSQTDADEMLAELFVQAEKEGKDPHGIIDWLLEAD